MTYIGGKLDPKQFGGLKGNSISHYMIELVNFILYNQDYDLPIAVLAATIDFSKAFNRLNHNLIITKLADMGVPGWLLNVVMGFLTDRRLLVKYKGVNADGKPLPGGGPQGTLLGLLLFLVLMNDCGFEENNTEIGKTITQKKKKFSAPTLHSKYVDDLTILQAVNLKEVIVPNPDRPLPDQYHARLGQKLDPMKSKVYEQIQNIQEYAVDNEMQLNFKKCKFMLFNPTINYDFIPDHKVGENDIETVEEMKLLGLVLRNDLKWNSNTSVMIKKAYAKLWMIRRLQAHGANLEDLKDVYLKQIRSILEFGVPVWNSSLTKEDSSDIERVQKAFLHLVLGDGYADYTNALIKLDLETLESRRVKLCTTFATKSVKHPKHQTWFELSDAPDTRSSKPVYKVPLHRLKRYKNSPIPYLTRLLNE